jgi:hypothetical protein
MNNELRKQFQDGMIGLLKKEREKKLFVINLIEQLVLPDSVMKEKLETMKSELTAEIPKFEYVSPNPQFDEWFRNEIQSSS